MLLFDPGYNSFSSSIENQDHKIVGIAALFAYEVIQWDRHAERLVPKIAKIGVAYACH